MNQEHQQNPGFFPNLISVGIFVFILAGMFFGFTRIYPELARRYIAINGNGNGEASVAEEIAPFVRGTTAGVEAAQLTSLQEPSGPLNINQISAYEYGMRSAILTSKNWYNLDRQLFRTNGIALGVMAAIDTSKTSDKRATLSYQIQLVQRTRAALSTDLDDLLGRSDDKQRALENYLNGLKVLASETEIEVNNMERILGESRAIIEENEAISEQFTDEFSAGDSAAIDRNLQPYLDAKRKVEEARIKGKTVNDVYVQLKPLAQQIPKVIEAIRANFEALAAGIKVTPTKGVNLPIFQ